MSKKNMESTRELMGTREVTDYSIRTYRNEELVYFLIQPSNISVLSEESLSARIYGLMTVLKGITEIEMMSYCSGDIGSRQWQRWNQRREPAFLFLSGRLDRRMKEIWIFTKGIRGFMAR